MSDQLKSMLNNLINDRHTEATLDLHEYITLTVKSLIGEGLESKIAYLEKNRGEKIVDAFKKDGSILKSDATAAQILAELAKADPSKGGDAINWIAKVYTAGEFKLEDVHRLHDDIEKFFKFRSKMENRDLNSYKSLNDLYDAIEKFDDADIEKSKKSVAKDIKNNEIEYLINTPDFKALITKTVEANKLYGSGTKWCTAAEKNNMFDTYHSQGPLIVIITKDNGKDRKFQLHVESDRFMNEKDIPLSKSEISYLSKFPQYKELLDIMIKKHYFSE